MNILSYYPQFAFLDTGYFLWSPKKKTVCYNSEMLSQNTGKLALLHEVSHALLDHRIYNYDIELINMEVEAWSLTKQLCQEHGVQPDEEHIGECLGSYDEWITKRSTCPTCYEYGIQTGRDQYRCILCNSNWSVNWRKDRRVTRFLQTV